VQVHHKKPFHLHPELELDPANLVTLCMTSSNECHLRIGHSGDFKAYNAALDQCLKLASAGTNVLVLADIAKKSKQYL
jgi:5-methylcytosine-specific restriction endonuclease McrA